MNLNSSITPSTSSSTIKILSTPTNPATTSKPSEWKTVSSKRKGSPLKPKSFDKQTKLTNYWLGSPATTSTSNQFDGLNEVEAEPQTIIEAKPPPIFINDVENIAPLLALLLSVAPEGYDVKIISSKNVKIASKTKIAYSAIINALTEKNTKFHTFQLKENRAFRVVLRHVHHSTDTDEIKKELQLLGHSVRNIHVVIQRTTKLPLPMFYIDLEPSPNNKDVYSIELFMHLRVKIEPPRQKREIVQCTKCQRYGHTKRFCFNNARCVKCVGNHSTESCMRDKSDERVQCVLCSGNHPANYRGCEIYKQLQAKQYPRLRQRSSQQPPSDPNQIAIPTSSSVQPNMSYANAVSNPRQNTQPLQPPESSLDTLQNHDMLELKQMMKMLIEQMSNMMSLLTVIVSNLHKK